MAADQQLPARPADAAPRPDRRRPPAVLARSPAPAPRRSRDAPYAFAGGTAVVTGAASGIGAALAAGLAERGSHLVLLDRDADGPGPRRRGHRADLPGPDRDLRRRPRRRRRDPPDRRHPRRRAPGHHAADQQRRRRAGRDVRPGERGAVRRRAGREPARGHHAHPRAAARADRAPRRAPGHPLQRLRHRGAARADRLLHQQVRRPRVHRVAARRAGARRGRRDLRAPRRRAHRHRPQRDGGRGRAARRRPRAWRSSTSCSRSPPADAAATILRAVERRRPRVLVGRDALVLDTLARLLPVTHRRLLAAATRLAARRS